MVSKLQISTIPDNVKNVSPMFVEIYEPSLYAEQYHLPQLVGIGFRKATEFLIKDFSIKNHPDSEDKIVKMPLMQVITSYFSSTPQLLAVAKATTWLGNDETHYNKIHTDKDLSDLKKFLRVLISVIDNELILEEATSFVQD